MSDSSWQALTRRVDRLERESRWWKRLASVTLVLAGYSCAPGRDGEQEGQKPY